MFSRQRVGGIIGRVLLNVAGGERWQNQRGAPCVVQARRPWQFLKSLTTSDITLVLYLNYPREPIQPVKEPMSCLAHSITSDSLHEASSFNAHVYLPLLASASVWLHHPAKC
jgi:hypothetical protein